MDRNDLDWNTQQLEIAERQLAGVAAWLLRQDPRESGSGEERVINDAYEHATKLRQRLAWLRGRGYVMEL